MPNTIETPTTEYQNEQNEHRVIEAQTAANRDLEDSREVENEYFVLGYN